MSLFRAALSKCKARYAAEPPFIGGLKILYSSRYLKTIIKKLINKIKMSIFLLKVINLKGLIQSG
jgi:hypothetical protein